MSKGSKRRPAQVSAKEWERNWDRAFTGRMIDGPEHITPANLRMKAQNLRYNGRAHAAQVLEWAADYIKALNEALEERRQECFDWIELNAKKDQRIAELEAFVAASHYYHKAFEPLCPKCRDGVYPSRCVARRPR